MAWRIGIDIGGTFTDVAMVEEETGRIGIAKVLTTPRDFGQGVIDGIRRGLAENAIDPADVVLLSHATTVVTNALLEHKGARAASSPRAASATCWSFGAPPGPTSTICSRTARSVLVPRRFRFEITERIDAQGEVVTPLATDELPALIEAVREAGLQTIAVSFLFSFLNDAHERAVGAALRAALPDVGVFLSCEVLPEIREFERASTTAVCAYVGPLLAGYLDRLQSAISRLGLPQLHDNRIEQQPIVAVRKPLAQASANLVLHCDRQRDLRGFPRASPALPGGGQSGKRRCSRTGGACETCRKTEMQDFAGVGIKGRQPGFQRGRGGRGQSQRLLQFAIPYVPLHLHRTGASINLRAPRCCRQGCNCFFFGGNTDQQPGFRVG